MKINKSCVYFICFLVSFSSGANEVNFFHKSKKEIIAYFIETGKKVIATVEKTTDHIEHESGSISTNELKNTLQNSKIIVKNGTLIDNTGSKADAIGSKNQVILDLKSWDTFITKKRDTRLLVLHEILRMAEINDDNFRVSSKYLSL